MIHHGCCEIHGGGSDEIETEIETPVGYAAGYLVVMFREEAQVAMPPFPGNCWSMSVCERSESYSIPSLGDPRLQIALMGRHLETRPRT